MDLQIYRDLIQRFHRAIMNNDVERLRSLVSESAGDPAGSGIPELPLSDVIEVTGVEIEGSGEVVGIQYTQKVGDLEYPMIAYFRHWNDTPKLDHWLPKKRIV